MKTLALSHEPVINSIRVQGTRANDFARRAIKTPLP
jgi:hypothetical protein